MRTPDASSPRPQGFTRRTTAMTDRYERIRKALAKGPTQGPSDATHGDAYLIAACDPDTIRALLEERDALARARGLIRKWRDEANAGYMTGVQKIDLVTNANASTWFRCADE